MMKFIKKHLSILGISMMICINAYAAEQVNISLNNQQTQDLGFAFISKTLGRTMVPLRFVSEELGYTVEWNAATRTAIISEDNNTVEIQIGSRSPKVNGATKTLDVPAVLNDSRTFVPVRFISEAMGAKVTYKNRTVFIEKENSKPYPLPKVSAIPGTATYTYETDARIIANYFGKKQYPGASSPSYMNDLGGIAFMVLRYDPDFDNGEPFDVQVRIAGWKRDTSVRRVPEEFRAQYQEPKAAFKEVLRYYLPNGAEKLYQLVDDGYNDRLENERAILNTDLQHLIGSDGKRVEIIFDNGLSLRIYR